MVSEGNIGKLTHGNVDELVRTNLSHDSIDTIITSPPYGDTISCHAGGPSSINDIGISCRTARSYTELDETIKRLRRYGRSNNKAGGPYGRSLGHPYSPSGENIGNMKKESYLQAMLTVYEQCHHVLKQHGKLILVVKNFIRDKKIVPLTDHTIVLCEHAGFKLMDHLLFKLPQKSFWRNLHKKKWDKEGREYPKDLSYEHILIFEKTQPGCEKFIYHEDF
jgi:DNA modification methylase